LASARVHEDISIIAIDVQKVFAACAQAEV